MDSWSEDTLSLAAVDITPTCWIWRGVITSEGYARYYRGRKENGRARYQYVHRLVYELFVGEIPPGFEIDHLCRVRRCVNPDHLEAVTKRTNRLRGVGSPAINAKKTHCKHGHEFSGRNLAIRNGKRACRKCDAIHHRIRRLSLV